MIAAPGVVGILLAAGRGERFGGRKLLTRLPSKHRFATGPSESTATRSSAPSQRDADIVGECIGAVSCRHLLLALPKVVAVVRPDDAALAAALGAAGAHVIRCPNADDGMGASLAYGVRRTPDATGWVVALGDMPWIDPETIARIAGALTDGAMIAAPFHANQRGHPVGFAAGCYDALAALTGDEGAKAVVQAHGHRIMRIEVNDPGVLADVDRPSDLGE